MAPFPALPSSSRTAPCTLCGERRFELLGEFDRDGKPLATVICQTCGLVAHETIPGDQELAAYYRSTYRTDYHGAYQPRPHHVIRAWRVGEHLVRKLSPHLKPGERVFEIGAGIGGTVKQFELAGWQATGIEPHDHYREYGRSHLHASLEPGVLDDVPATPWYDLVILHHVLEHLPHPLQALEHVRRMLRLGGRAYVEVPNLAAPHAAPGKQFHFAHLYNFTPGTLTAVAAAAGLGVKEILTRPTDEVLGLLLVVDARAHGSVDYAGNYAAAREGLSRYSSVAYHCRPNYLRHRAGRLVWQVADRCGAPQRLRNILNKCAAKPQRFLQKAG